MLTMYDDPEQFEPLTIASSRPCHAALLGAAHELSEASARLDAAIPRTTGRSLSELVVGMNCYYSNLIEGHRTLPLDIERALHVADGKAGRLRDLALAHIDAERWARQPSAVGESLPDFLREIHRRFCVALPEAMLQLTDGSRLVPGEFRRREVSVGQHVAPRADALPGFLERYAEVYGRSVARAGQGGIVRLAALVDVVAAHHRLVWVHPFADGNGRVARIVLDVMLRRCGLDPAGLWSLSRGFAKTQDEYKARLAAADEPRHGALDGRGALSERRLAEFCTYALQCATDQARFMQRLFALDSFEKRCFHYFSNVRLDLKAPSAYLFIHAVRAGEFERMEAGRLTGLPERTARDVLGKLVAEGFLRSDTPRGKLRAGFPVSALGTLFPNLYPAGDVDFS